MSNELAIQGIAPAKDVLIEGNPDAAESLQRATSPLPWAQFTPWAAAERDSELIQHCQEVTMPVARAIWLAVVARMREHSFDLAGHEVDGEPRCPVALCRFVRRRHEAEILQNKVDALEARLGQFEGQLQENLAGDHDQSLKRLAKAWDEQTRELSGSSQKRNVQDRNLLERVGAAEQSERQLAAATQSNDSLLADLTWATERLTPAERCASDPERALEQVQLDPPTNSDLSELRSRYTFVFRSNLDMHDFSASLQSSNPTQPPLRQVR